MRSGSMSKDQTFRTSFSTTPAGPLPVPSAEVRSCVIASCPALVGGNRGAMPPCRWLVAWYGYGRLAGLQLRYRPAKQANIDVGQRPRVGGLEHDAPPGSFGPSTHSHIMSASAGRHCHHGVHQQLAEADDRPRWHHDHRVAWLAGTVLLRAGCTRAVMFRRHGVGRRLLVCETTGKAAEPAVVPVWLLPV